MKTVHSLLLSIAVLACGAAWAQCNSIIDQNFDHWSDRPYTVEDAKSDFNNQIKPWTASTYRGIGAPGAVSTLIGDVKQETRIVNGELRAEYTKDDAGGYAGGFLFDPYFDGVEEAYLEYKVKFDDNFFWATGGKLPGLGGSTSGIGSESTGRGTIPSGCKYNTNGWSARLMWRRNRAQNNTPYLILYSYFAERENGEMRVDGDCGDGKRIYTGLEDDTWYTIRQYIKMNTPGEKDGTVVMWIDGDETYRDEQALIRNAGKGSLNINALIMNTYRGGSRTDTVWHSPRDEFAFFDDFKVWTGCSEPPGSTNSAPTGQFDQPTFDSIDEGYDQLYVLVSAEDLDNDPVTTTLKIDGETIRTESKQPFEWGRTNSPDTTETLSLAPGEHLFEVEITDAQGAATVIHKTIVVNDVVIAPSLAITYPEEGDYFAVGEAFDVTAIATDSDGAIDRVNFKLDGGYYAQDSNGADDVYLSNYQFNEPGVHVIGVRAFDDEGGSTEVSITVEVTQVTGNQKLGLPFTKVYPNPTANNVVFQQSTAWRLFNLSGQLLDQGRGWVVDLTRMSTGTYLLKTNGKVQRVVKR